MQSARLLLLALLLGAAIPVSAQQPEEVRRVVLVDGTVLVGQVIDEDADPVVLVTPRGVEQRIPRQQIAAITLLLEGRFRRYDPASTRLFVSPTARSLGTGAGRISAYWLFPSVAYGITDRVDGSVGLSVPAIGSGGDFFTLLNLNVKGAILQQETAGVAIGASAIIPVGTGVDAGVAGTLYGVATLGTRATAFTLGGFGIYSSDFGEVEFASGVILLGGFEHQLSDSIKFISENYLAVEFEDGLQGSILSAGVRFFGDRLAADAAAFALIGGGEFFVSPLPFLGLSYTFGRPVIR